MKSDEIFVCSECGLHYESNELAQQCEAFCKANNGCSLEITQYSIERRNKTKESPQNL